MQSPKRFPHKKVLYNELQQYGKFFQCETYFNFFIRFQLIICPTNVFAVKSDTN